MNKIDMPKRVIFEITQKCNYKCDDCISKNVVKDLSKDDIILIGKKLVQNGIPSISWTGGEPLIRKDIFDIMHEIIKYNKKTIHTLNTNGSLVNEDIARKCIGVFNLVRITIYGNLNTFNNVTYNKIYSYNTSLLAIEHFLKYNIPVQINVPVYDLSDIDIVLNDIDNKFGENDKIKEIVFIPRIKSNLSTNNYPSYNEILESINKYNNNKIRVFEWGDGKHFLIKANGEVYAHPFGDDGLFLGNAVKEKLLEIWDRFPLRFLDDHVRLTPDISYLKK